MCLRSNLSRQCDYVSMGERVGLYISTSKTKELRLQGVRNPLFIFLQGYIPSYLNFWLNWSRLPLFLLKSCLPYWTWYSNCLVRKKCVSWLGDSGSGGFWVSLGKNCCKKGAEPKTSQRLLCSFFVFVCNDLLTISIKMEKVHCQSERFASVLWENVWHKPIPVCVTHFALSLQLREQLGNVCR